MHPPSPLALRIGRASVAVIGLLFAALGAGFLATPDQAAARFHLEAIGVAGLTTARADLGGLFIGLAVLCWTGAWMKRRSLLLAAATVIAAVVCGRLIGLIASGSPDIPAFVIEIVAIAALVFYAQSLRTNGAAPRSPRRFVPIGVAALVVLGIGAVILDHSVQQSLFDAISRRMLQPERTELLTDDALRVVICGSSGPPPSAARAKACVIVAAGGKFYVVDVGPESVEHLVQWNLPLASIGGVLITHFHSDHIGDLGELNLQTWAQGRPMPLPVYGGPGVEQVVEGFNQAYRLDQGYRTEHHGARMMPAETWPMVAHRVEPEGENSPRQKVILDDGALRITVIGVDHGPVTPAYAYRFDYKGRSAVVTGDLQSYPPLAVAAAGADVLVSEALARPMIKTLEQSAAAAGRDRVAAILHDIQSYHLSPQEAADIANRAKVKLLVFYHLLPAPDAVLSRRLFGYGVDAVRDSDWVIADDGSLYTLPIGTEEVRIGRIDR